MLGKNYTNSTYIRLVTKPAGGNQNYSLVLNNGKPHIRFDGGTGQNYAESPTSVADGNWHHLAGVHDTDNDTIKIYVDGVLMASSSTTGNPVSSTEDMFYW